MESIESGRSFLMRLLLVFAFGMTIICLEWTLGEVVLLCWPLLPSSLQAANCRRNGIFLYRVFISLAYMPSGPGLASSLSILMALSISELGMSLLRVSALAFSI